jgi:hypothetical protein
MKKWKIESGLGPNQAEVRPEHSRARRHETRRDREYPSKRRPNVGRALLTGLLAVSLVAAPSMAFAESKALEVSREGGLGAASAVSSLVYGPVKLIYAIGGLIVGSFAWVFTAGDSHVAETVFSRSLRGNYVITPEILLGEKPLEFIGRDIAEAESEAATVASVDTAPQSSEDMGYDELGW